MILFFKFKSWEDLDYATIEQLEEILKPLSLFRRRAQRLFKIAKVYEKWQGKLPRTKNRLQEANLGAHFIRNAFELFVLKKGFPLLDVNMARIIEVFSSRTNIIVFHCTLL